MLKELFQKRKRKNTKNIYNIYVYISNIYISNKIVPGPSVVEVEEEEKKYS